MRVVDDEPRVESLREKQELGQRRDVAVHAEHRVGDDEPAASDRGFHRTGQRSHVAMRGSVRVWRARAARRRSGTRGSTGRRISRRCATRARSGSRGWQDSRWKMSARARRRTARRRQRAHPRARRAVARARRSGATRPHRRPSARWRRVRRWRLRARWRAPGNRCWRTRAARGRRWTAAAPAPNRRSVACAQGRGRGAARVRARAPQSPGCRQGAWTRRRAGSTSATHHRCDPPRGRRSRGCAIHAGTRPSLPNSARSASTSGLPVVSRRSP